ncbi:N-acetylmuramoyl-L-alanine amidase family protein [Methylomicrobium sp. RS1]|uniref:N-acetylmuramoyl-L-alanine amidase family protein n=1 Tax=Candidatus Methylomicrobium oryzae TaxID=2802053 RepID=UPI001922587C|nr:N-acetylmuramoyl-L-alanine amidase [Methylomicrobium sp. RS1]MBL1262790.1 N-acetylmuramoyl-L-alanine amidase [Methylomicrobium sp. RS1]
MTVKLILCFLLISSANAADVTLDVGHSRRHPGVISAGGVPEWELNRQLAEEIAKRLRQKDVSYRLIGADGAMEVLAKRTDLAKHDALFISLHHDSVQPEWLKQVERYRGYSLFVSRHNPKIGESLACAREIGDRLLAAGFHPSLYHAAPVAGENRPFADRDRGIHYYDGLAVLRTARQPAVLIEAGVAVNLEDELRVTGKVGRVRIAEAVARGVADCLRIIRTSISKEPRQERKAERFD